MHVLMYVFHFLTYCMSEINDTMKDLYVNLIGSIMGSSFVYLILKEKDI